MRYTQCRRDLTLLSPRNRGSVYSSIAAPSDFRTFRRLDVRFGMLLIVRTDFHNYLNFDTRPKTQLI